MPLWVFEGMSDYMTGVWRPIDLMYVRDAAVSDQVPKMSELQGYGNFGNARTIYNLGHAAFEFIEARWGKEGVRQFVFSLRKSVIGGGENAFREAFDMDAEEWDQQFDRYLKDRFKPFRDKERPADYGRNLAPNPERTRYSNVLSIEPSPSGDLIAAATGNNRDRELDIVLLSTKDGAVIRSLTPGFDQSLGFESIPTPGMRFVSVPWMSWAPAGDRLAYFVRTEKDRSLVVQNVITRKIDTRVPMLTVDAPESPDFSPDGRTIAFSAARGLINDIYSLNLETKEIVNLTNDEFADYAPTFAPDGRSIVYLKRISGNEKLFQLDIASGKSTQLTFGTHDEGARAVPRRRHAGLHVHGHWIRPSRSIRTRRETAPSITCGRSTCKAASSASSPTRSAATTRPQCCATARRTRALRSSRSTRATTTCTLSTGRSRWPPRRRLISALRDRLSTSRRR